MYIFPLIELYINYNTIQYNVEYGNTVLVLCVLNPHCRHTIFLPTLTNTPKTKAISEVVCIVQVDDFHFYFFFLTEVANSLFSIVTFLQDLHYRWVY